MSEAVYKNNAIRNTIKQILALRTDEEILRLPTPLTDDQQWQYDRIFEIMRIKVSVHLFALSWARFRWQLSAVGKYLFSDRATPAIGRFC